MSAKTIVMKVRLSVLSGETAGETRDRVQAVLDESVVASGAKRYLARMEISGMRVEEQREVAPGGDAWVSLRGLLGTDRVPAEVGNVLDRAMKKAARTAGETLSPWQALELIAADFNAGPG